MSERQDHDTQRDGAPEQQIPHQVSGSPDPPKRVLITGGSGFIGTNVVQCWHDLGVQVVNIDVAAPRNPDHRDFWSKADLTNRDELVGAVREFQPDCILHLGARTDIRGSRVDEYAANTVGVENIVAAARAAGARRVLFASSQLVCTPGHQPTSDDDYCPPNAYGESKVVGEQIVRREANDDFEWALLRPTSIWGPWFEMPYRAFFDAVRRGRYVHIRGVTVRKSFGYVGNAVEQIARLTTAPAGHIHKRVLYIADYEAVHLGEWAEMVRAAWDSAPIKTVPLAPLRVAARLGDVAKALGVREPPITSYRLKNMITSTPQQMEPLRRLCGSMPYTVLEGTSRTVEWLRAREG